ncbi:hypothetical protein D8674_004694 [Pyrus ussuriensis x Pyrus communis]|uniref:Uncharacterized protein n=1 Tax=Pyrus ussuriensis x Pyrus communis TaxID=2448454 RepID=A0A5N5FKL4_9ROSA|nr:hypothetical protein D8674_004694 [Pyrus ussuriensis x Pyrus communis]
MKKSNEKWKSSSESEIRIKSLPVNGGNVENLERFANKNEEEEAKGLRPQNPREQSELRMKRHVVMGLLLSQSSRGGNETSQSIVKEGEKIKLIQESYDENSSSDSLVHVSSSSQSISRTEELKIRVKDDIPHGKNEAVLVSIGLSVGRALPRKLLGSCPESIGIGSNGSVHLDGNS